MAAERQLLTRDAKALAIVLTFGALLRVLLMLGSSGILWADSYIFYTSAESLLAGDLLSHDAFKTPLYPAFLAAFMALGQTPATGALVIGVQHLLGLLSTALFYRVARQIFETPVAFFSSLLFTSHTLLLFYESSVLSEILFVFLLSLLLNESLRALARGALWRYGMAGALGGLVTLTRPVAQGFVFCIVTVIVAAGRASKRSIAAAMVVGGVYGAVMLPWLYVNSQTYGFWGVSLGRGLGLFIRVFEIDRLEPRADTRFPLVRDVLGSARGRGGNVSYVVRDELNFRHGHSSYSADVAMHDFAFETVSAHPWTYVRLSASAWIHQLLLERQDPEICRARGGPYLCTSSSSDMSNAMFPNQPPPGRRSLKRNIADWFTTAYVRMWIVVPLALVGILCHVWARGTTSKAPKAPRSKEARTTAGAVLLIVAIVYFTIIPALIQWPEERYRLPIDALLFMFAVSGTLAIAAGVRRVVGRGSSPWAARPALEDTPGVNLG